MEEEDCSGRIAVVAVDDRQQRTRRLDEINCSLIRKE